jgi:hypothetical protein
MKDARFKSAGIAVWRCRNTIVTFKSKHFKRVGIGVL